MTWTVQLTPWALPSLLGVLFVVRGALELWPRRREPAVPALLTLGFAAGLWALLHLVTVVTSDEAAKTFLVRLQYLPATAAPLAWLWFGFAFARRSGSLLRWPLWILYVASVATVAFALSEASPLLMERSVSVVVDGVVLLQVVRGPWHWVHLAVRVAAVAAATVVLAAGLARTPGSRGRVATVVLGALLALLPLLLRLRGGAADQWTNLAPLGFAFAFAAVGWAALRHRLLELGPVARTLVVEELRDPVVVMDGRGRIVDVNRAAERDLGLTPYGDVPLALGTLWAGGRRDAGRVSQVLLERMPSGGGEGDEPAAAAGEGDEPAAAAGEEAAGDAEAGRDGDPAGDEDAGGPARGEEGDAPAGPEERTFEVTITPLAARGGRGRSILVLRDVTRRDRMERELRTATEALTEANRELKRRANTDPLTGLANRRHFMEQLEREVDRAARYGHPLSVVVLDLDHFKRVNDTWGHAAGDDALRGTAEVLRAVSRDVDLPARIGGEEMALLLPDTDEEGARVVAERVRERTEAAEHLAPDGRDFAVTASLGVATLRGGGGDGESLLNRADQALYRAKARGRNRVEGTGG